MQVFVQLSTPELREEPGGITGYPPHKGRGKPNLVLHENCGRCGDGFPQGITRGFEMNKSARIGETPNASSSWQ